MDRVDVALEIEKRAEWAALASAACLEHYSISCATFCVPARYNQIQHIPNKMTLLVTGAHVMFQSLYRVTMVV